MAILLIILIILALIAGAIFLAFKIGDFTLEMFVEWFDVACNADVSKKEILLVICGIAFCVIIIKFVMTRYKNWY